MNITEAEPAYWQENAKHFCLYAIGNCIVTPLELDGKLIKLIIIPLLLTDCYP